MDGLGHDERALAWAASWNPSFSGIAIVNEDFTFRSVNHQFCKILGVTPAELIGCKFQDVTPAAIRQLDESNAKLVIKGVISNYILQKTYEFANGHKVEVILLVTGVYRGNKFLFFVSRIVQMPPSNTQSNAPRYFTSQQQTDASSTEKRSWLRRHYKNILGGAALALGAFIKGLYLGKE